MQYFIGICVHFHINIHIFVRYLINKPTIFATKRQFLAEQALLRRIKKIVSWFLFSIIYIFNLGYIDRIYRYFILKTLLTAASAATSAAPATTCWSAPYTWPVTAAATATSATTGSTSATLCRATTSTAWWAAGAVARVARVAHLDLRYNLHRENISNERFLLHLPYLFAFREIEWRDAATCEFWRSCNVLLVPSLSQSRCTWFISTRNTCTWI